MADYAALRAGQAAAVPCLEWLHDNAEQFSECLRFVAAHPASPAADWWALGALHYGWLTQDVVAQAGESGADEEARALVREAEVLRRRLRAPDTALCRLVELPCTIQQKRREERLAGR